MSISYAVDGKTTDRGEGIFSSLEVMSRLINGLNGVIEEHICFCSKACASKKKPICSSVVYRRITKRDRFIKEGECD